MLRSVPCRIVLAILSWFGFFNLYVIRFNFSIISVAMFGTNHTPSLDANFTTRAQKGTVQISHDLLGIIMGSFFLGYALTQIIGGRLAELYGTKIIFGIAIVVPGALSYLTPVAARISPWALIALRVLMGLIQGMSYPSMHALLTRWIPPNERPRYVGTICLASSIGFIVTQPVCGAIIDNLGWEEAFYICGVSPLVWGIAWYLLVYSTPQQHPRITEEEKDFIHAKISEGGTDAITSKRKVPWKSIAKSVPFHGINICDIGNSFCVTIFTTVVPSYFKHVFQFDYSATGFLSAGPILSRYIGAIVFSHISSFIMTRKLLSVTNTRRVISTISMFCPAVFTLCIAFSVSLQNTFIFMCCALFCNGAISGAYFINHTDIAPNFAGTLLGITNTSASIASLIAPVVAELIVGHNDSQIQWSYVFIMLAPIYSLCETAYLLMLSGDPQPWNFSIGRQNEEEISLT